MMTMDQIRLKQNPVLTSMLLGMGQGTMVAERLFPRLPQSLRGMTIATMGKQSLQRYNLRRAPGANTRRIEIKYDGQVYTVDQYAVEVPIPRELIDESNQMQKLNVAGNLAISTIAMTTASDVLALDYEIEAAGVASDPDTYDGNVLAYSGATKWSASTGTPVTDIRAAAEQIRKRTGLRPNQLMLSADAFQALCMNAEVKSYLPRDVLGPATMDQLKTILNVADIVIGDAIWVDGNGASTDVWGNVAVLCYVPAMGAGFSLAQPAFGFTSTLPGNPFAETPYFSNETKSWIYGATYERRVNLGLKGAGFLFQNCK